MSSMRILAPFDGWCTALEEVPDEMFSARMLGDGLAIDPVSDIVRAPCDGRVVTVAASGHAVAVQSAQGVEILVHIGIDTVQLAGRGFEPRIAAGATVRAGDELIRFDLDLVARGAKSLLTPIIVTPRDGLTIRRRCASGIVAAGDLLFEIAGLPFPAAAALQGEDAGAHAVERSFAVALRQGLHARPAARLAQRLRSFAAAVSMSANGRSADARSVVAIMALGARHGDELRVRASGADAAPAVDALVAALDEALRAERDEAHPGAPPKSAPATAAAPRAAHAPDGQLSGVAAVPGFAVGRAARFTRREIAVAEAGRGAVQERAALADSIGRVRRRLERAASGGEADACAARRQIVAAHVEFLSDPLIDAAAQEAIAAGKSAAFAWRGAIRRQVALFEVLNDARLRERADDLLDIEAQVLAALRGEAPPPDMPLPERAVLIADDLLPSELNALDRRRLAAICLGRGGASAHVAILAAALGVPMLVGLGAALHGVADGATVIVDADAGTLQFAPDEAAVAQAQARVERRRARDDALRASAQEPCRSGDGTRIEVFANLGSVADAAAAIAGGAEGCGLLRTEFLFIDRETAPTEQEQLDAYQAIAAALADRPLVLRLMDVGGDKPLRYVPLPAEDNPALGLRGVRTALARPDLLRTQIAAALGAGRVGQVRLLLPMVTDVAEIAAVRAVIDELRLARGIAPRMQVGAMIETPAAAMIAEHLVAEVDFLSIGSNDLTQYTLAMDRGHPQLAARADALHPAVLRLIGATVAAAAGKPVAVCGRMAADPAAIPILIGLGVGELSVAPAAVPAVKQRVRSLDVDRCRALAARCLAMGSAGEVRAYIGQSLVPLEDLV